VAAVLVAAVSQSVGPGCEDLATPVCGTLVDSEPVDHVLSVDSIAAQSAADLRDLKL
jgi:hypothetical protein